MFWPRPHRKFLASASASHFLASALASSFSGLINMPGYLCNVHTSMIRRWYFLIDWLVGWLIDHSGKGLWYLLFFTGRLHAARLCQYCFYSGRFFASAHSGDRHVPSTDYRVPITWIWHGGADRTFDPSCQIDRFRGAGLVYGSKTRKLLILSI